MTNTESAQNVIYITGRNKTQLRRSLKTASITDRTVPVTGNTIMKNTHLNVVDGIIKVHFASENKHKSALA